MMEDVSLPPMVAAVDADVLLWPLRAFYVLAAYVIVVVRFTPALRHRFLNYGARSHQKTGKITKTALPGWVRIQIDPAMDWLAGVTVPHGWFTHFYVCSTICSATWLFYFRNRVREAVTHVDAESLSTTQNRAVIALMLLQLQGLRRLYECVLVAKTSQSRMWVGHYAIGIAFYVATNIAVWIESALESPSMSSQTLFLPKSVAVFNVARVVMSTYAFLWSSYKQYQVHRYLASLKEYRVPDHRIFRETNLVCPHYAFEVYIYLALTILTAPSTRILNITMLCATMFVVVNLGVTADLTKKWLLERFPKQSAEIAPRKRMLRSIW